MDVSGEALPGGDDFEWLCDVCQTGRPKGVYAMPGVPGSFAYCDACLQANAHPYGVMVANTAMIGGLAEAADWWQRIVDDTLAHLGIERDAFLQDVAVVGRSLGYELNVSPMPDEVPQTCPTAGCIGDTRYPAPGRGHSAGCDYPAGLT